MREKRKLLLVDDDDIQLSIAEYMLMNEFEVITAKSGKEALDILDKGLVPSLILLDILMPHMDGWETYTNIRALDFLRDVPIVFLTALNEAREEKYAQEIGVVDYIIKPFAKNDLLKRVEAILKKTYGSKTTGA